MEEEKGGDSQVPARSNMESMKERILKYLTASVVLYDASDTVQVPCDGHEGLW